MLGNNDNLSDSIILATFNPNTMKATMTSVPRDSYVPIACYPGQTFDKINHSRGISRECMIDTVENFLDVDIDFYFETDFYALEKIVDALGGLDIESPLQFAGSFPIENSNPVEYEPITVPKA
ncbi:LCP family protein [Erysipelothrix sp. D19-032]